MSVLLKSCQLHNISFLHKEFWFTIFRKTLLSEAIPRRLSIKSVLKTADKFLEKYLCRSLLFNNVPGCRLKRNLIQVFSFEFCKTFKNNYFAEHLRLNASELSSSVFLTRDTFCKIQIVAMHSFIKHFRINAFYVEFRILYNPKGVIRTLSNNHDGAFLR